MDEGDEIHVDSTVEDDGEQLFRTMLSVTSDPVCALDDDWKVVAVDDDLTDLTGYDRSELLGADVSILLDRDDARTLEMLVAKAGRSDASLDGEFDLILSDGTVRRCELQVTLSPGGTVVVAVRDVTGLRRREERIEVLDRVLRHNIRNKIGTVIGYIDTLIDGAASDETARQAKVARNEAEELLSLSDKARRFHKLLGLEPVRTTVEDLGPNVVAVVEEYRADHPRVDFELNLPDHPPVFVDQELVEAALEEVIGNAIEHHDGDSPTVTVSAVAEGSRVHLRVADDGPGIPAEEREAVMEGNERPLYHASGLGIWFVKWSLQLSGGRLFIEPNHPTGTVMVFSLPRADVDPRT